MSSIELLEKEYNDLLRSLGKSIKSFSLGKIDKETHHTHVSNLIPLIADYDASIKILKAIK